MTFDISPPRSFMLLYIRTLLGISRTSDTTFVEVLCEWQEMLTVMSQVPSQTFYLHHSSVPHINLIRQELLLPPFIYIYVCKSVLQLQVITSTEVKESARELWSRNFEVPLNIHTHLYINYLKQSCHCVMSLCVSTVQNAFCRLTMYTQT